MITRDDFTTFVFTVDDRLLRPCLETIAAQTVQPPRIELIQNISPLSKAWQAVADRAKTPLALTVDEDLLLEPTCFEQMLGVMDRCGEKTYLVLGFVEDRFYPDRLLQIPKLFRAAAMRQAKFQDCATEDATHDKQVRAKGYVANSDLRDVVLGTHCENVPPDVHFRRFVADMMKARTGRFREEAAGLVERLARYALENPSPESFAAVMGALTGGAIPKDECDQSPDMEWWKKFRPHCYAYNEPFDWIRNGMFGNGK